MTIATLLAKVDRLKPNQVAEADKIAWLSDCDTYIFKSIIQTHEPEETTPETFAGYDSETDKATTVLLAETPYDELYVYWLYMQIDLANMELNKYNNDVTLYNSAIDKYAAFYNRTHAPIETVTYYTI